jgi:hypothetical protein
MQAAPIPQAPLQVPSPKVIINILNITLSPSKHGTMVKCLHGSPGVGGSNLHQIIKIFLNFPSS